MTPQPNALRVALDAAEPRLPDYLVKTYRWAYLEPRNVAWLDRSCVVSLILWGNARRLMDAALREFAPATRVLQAACVYGDFSRRLADRIGADGCLEIFDVAPVQLARTAEKTRDLPQVRLHRADLASSHLAVDGQFDAVCCFFLLHELPASARRQTVRNLLAAVASGGKVVFVDYHRPAPWHPLRPLMSAVFRWLEPYAESLLAQEIQVLADDAAQFSWRCRTAFGGLYQQVVATRLPPKTACDSRLTTVG